MFEIDTAATRQLHWIMACNRVAKAEADGSLAALLAIEVFGASVETIQSLGWPIPEEYQ